MKKKCVENKILICLPGIHFRVQERARIYKKKKVLVLLKKKNIRTSLHGVQFCASRKFGKKKTKPRSGTDDKQFFFFKYSTF